MHFISEWQNCRRCLVVPLLPADPESRDELWSRVGPVEDLRLPRASDQPKSPLLSNHYVHGHFVKLVLLLPICLKLYLSTTPVILPVAGGECSVKIAVIATGPYNIIQYTVKNKGHRSKVIHYTFTHHAERASVSVC